ncbi:hypothetical protein IAG41_00215 [Sphingomonas sp. JC676]|uniref:hypothetical protein n=1 Tax=Sphingomonas sp. JC676 TaxID=2768065 RepID=UPI001657A424|nr:hypothetical protein [Sphingomonas sp. JC676]MBC9030805.1 hypothetical protein [Sphingomonas sp. JC676]
MKGKILGFTPSAGSGAIAGADGERFSFVAAQWRSDKAITVGASVDFAPVAGVATEIYPVVAAAPIQVGELAASPAVQKARGLFMTTLAAPLAALLLIATFLPAISSPISSASLWGMGSLAQMVSANPLLANDDVAGVREALQELDARETDLRTNTAGFGGMPMDNSAGLRMVAKERVNLQAQLSRAQFASTIGGLLVIRWLVPIGAIALLAFAWMEKSTRVLALATGAAAAVTAAILYEYREVLVGSGSPAGSIGGMISRQMGAVVSLGFGTYLIGLCGIALVLAGLGILKNPLAARA